MTPFYDDLEIAISKSDDPNIQQHLKASKDEISKLIYGRNMLS
jgi:hypothetical protein